MIRAGIPDYRGTSSTRVSCPSRAIAFTEHEFENLLWKSDCYLNPHRPQFGTWKFSRAGWAPGDVVRPWWIDLSEHIQPGKTAVLR